MKSSFQQALHELRLTLSAKDFLKQRISAPVASGSDTIIYIGFARPGTATSAAGWQVQRITDKADTSVEIDTVADPQTDQVWDDRASLTYV